MQFAPQRSVRTITSIRNLLHPLHPMTSKSIIPTVLSVLCLTGSLTAQVLQLDFGPTVADGDSLTNSPYHTASGSIVDSTWNTVTDANLTSSLVWSDGTATSGISIDVGGNSTSGSTTIDLAKTGITFSNALGSMTDTGVYAGTSVGKDGIFLATSGARAVGVQVSGLSAGNYDIYITARNTSLSSAHDQNLYVGTASAGNFNYTDYAATSQQISYNGAADATASWVAAGNTGDNYVKFSISITSGQVLNLASIGGTGEARGFLNSVQIVSTIPEPSTYAFLAGAGSLLIAATRRKLRSRSGV